MLPKKNRLSFPEVNELKKSQTPLIQGRFFGLIFQKKPEDRKFGLIISTKVAPKAVSRNQVKRELFRAVGQVLPETRGWFLFLAKKTCLEAIGEDFNKELEFFRARIQN